MQSDVNRITVYIDGQPHSLVTDEDPTHIARTAQQIDVQLRDLRRTYPALSVERLLLLALLETTSENIQIKQQKG
ncbi:MAG: cell division protein ZapA [Bacilli bacterium]